jgi:hypothetical protein
VVKYATLHFIRGHLHPDEPNKFSWSLTSSGKSMYTDFMNDHTRYLHKYLWKLKVPLKIKTFMWFLNRKVLLTKDNLIKRC